MQATGTFQVKMSPQPAAPDAPPDPARGRFAMEKTFEGAITGESKGEMLTGGDPATGSAGYVAIERVTGTLEGKAGSFLLQHSGTMHAGQLSQSITVIPASGTGELAGISGAMTIQIVDRKHFYTLDYELSARA